MIFGPYKGVIDSVHDGDTVNVKLDVGFDLTIYARVRIYGINAPELATPAGKAAREFALTLVKPGDAVEVTTYGWDKFGGRVDGGIAFGIVQKAVNQRTSRDFALEMIAAGHAVEWYGQGAKPVPAAAG